MRTSSLVGVLCAVLVASCVSARLLRGEYFVILRDRATEANKARLVDLLKVLPQELRLPKQLRSEEVRTLLSETLDRTKPEDGNRIWLQDLIDLSKLSYDLDSRLEETFLAFWPWCDESDSAIASYIKAHAWHKFRPVYSSLVQAYDHGFRRHRQEAERILSEFFGAALMKSKEHKERDLFKILVSFDFASSPFNAPGAAEVARKYLEVEGKSKEETLKKFITEKCDQFQRTFKHQARHVKAAIAIRVYPNDARTMMLVEFDRICDGYREQTERADDNIKWMVEDASEVCGHGLCS